MKKDKLYFLTFLSLLIVVYIVGYFCMNYLLELSTKQFLKIQIESSKREAKEMASFISLQINNGVDKEIITNNIQSSIENTNTEMGFICMFDWKGKEICHPDPMKIGKTTSPDESYISGIKEEINSKDFYTYLKDKKEGGGVRNFNDTNRKSEIIYLYPVKHTDWIIAAHANMSKIHEEHESLKVNFMVVFTATGALIVLFSLLMVRIIGSNYEKKFEQKNEKLSKEVLSLSKLNQGIFISKENVDSDKNLKEEVSENTLPKKRILTHFRNEIVPLETEEIAHIYTENTITYVKSVDGKTSNSNCSLDDLYNRLDNSLFFRANRQFILSIKAIDKILKYGNSQLKIEVIPKSSTDIIISKNKAAEFRNWINR